MENKRPAFQFYPADWLNDWKTKMATFEEKGFLIDLICLVHQSPKYGYLTKEMEATLPELLGKDRRTSARLLAKVREKSLMKVDELTGELYNNRMVKDEAIRSLRAEAGKLGGNPNLLKQKVKQKTTPSSSSSSSSSSSDISSSLHSEDATPPKKTMSDFLKGHSDKTETFQQFVSVLASKYKISPENMAQEIDKFVNYWSELTPNGKKMRWQTEKVFEVQRRLVTWFSNSQKFNSNKGGSIVKV